MAAPRAPPLRTRHRGASHTRDTVAPQRTPASRASLTRHRCGVHSARPGTGSGGRWPLSVSRQTTYRTPLASRQRLFNRCSCRCDLPPCLQSSSFSPAWHCTWNGMKSSSAPFLLKLAEPLTWFGHRRTGISWTASCSVGSGSWEDRRAGVGLPSADNYQPFCTPLRCIPLLRLHSGRYLDAASGGSNIHHRRAARIMAGGGRAERGTTRQKPAPFGLSSRHSPHLFFLLPGYPPHAAACLSLLSGRKKEKRFCRKLYFSLIYDLYMSWEDERRRQLNDSMDCPRRCHSTALRAWTTHLRTGTTLQH